MATPETTPEDIKEKMGVEGQAGDQPKTPEEGKVEPPADAGKEPEQDYKKMWGDSTREVQEKYLPMEKQFKYMNEMIDKHPDLAETWEKVLEKETGQASAPAATPAEETSDKRLTRLENERKEEKISLTNEAIREFRSSHQEMNDTQYEQIAANASSYITRHATQMPFKEAVRHALEDEYFLQNKDKVKEEGRKEHILEQKKNEAATFPQATSAQTSSSKEVLTSGQKSVAENLGVDPEKAAKYVK